MKKKLIWLCIFLPGLFYLVEWLTAGTPLNTIPFTGYTLSDGTKIATNVFVVVGAFAYGVGLINVFRVHSMAVLNRKKNWQYSLVVFISFVVILGVCLYGLLIPAATKGDLTPLTFFVDYVFTPLVATVMALLGFYITYAAYRAFKVRSVDGIVMMSVAVIVMLGYDPIGNVITYWLKGTKIDYLQLPVVAQFFMTTMNSAVFRSLNLGIAIATIAISWRIWLGFESQLTQAE